MIYWSSGLPLATRKVTELSCLLPALSRLLPGACDRTRIAVDARSLQLADIDAQL